MELIKAYVTLPSSDLFYNKNNELDRNKYISDSLQNNIIRCLTEDGRCMNVRLAFNSQNVNDGFLDALDFPINVNQRGTALLVIKMDFDGGYYAICRLSELNQFHLDEEFQMKLFKTSGYNLAGIDIRGLLGIINILVRSKDNDGGKITIESQNNNNNAEINLKSDLINLIMTSLNITILDLLNFVIRKDLNTTEYTQIKYKVGEGFTFSDEFGNEINQNNDVLELKHKSKINLGNGSEPMVLGNKINELLDSLNINLTNDLISLVSALQTLYSALSLTLPPSILTNIQAHKFDFNTNLQKILSTYSNTD